MVDEDYLKDLCSKVTFRSPDDSAWFEKASQAPFCEAPFGRSGNGAWTSFGQTISRAEQWTLK